MTRTENVTASDPATGAPANPRLEATGLDASDPVILDSVIGPDEIHLYESKEQHGNWLDCIRSRQQPISPVEMGHRACSTCLLHHIAMEGGEAPSTLGPAEGAVPRKTQPPTHCSRARKARAPYTFSQA